MTFHRNVGDQDQELRASACAGNAGGARNIDQSPDGAASSPDGQREAPAFLAVSSDNFVKASALSPWSLKPRPQTSRSTIWGPSRRPQG
jgi:hypothetical protein